MSDPQIPTTCDRTRACPGPIPGTATRTTSILPADTTTRRMAAWVGGLLTDDVPVPPASTSGPMLT